MPFLPPTVSFPEADTFVRYWDYGDRTWKYLHLIERDLPLIWPERLPSLAPGSQGDLVIFNQIDPSEDKHHAYKLYMGCYPDFFYELWHPYDSRQLGWDERPTNIEENLTRQVTWEESPVEAPTKSIWIIHERYPGVRARNVGYATKTPRIVWLGAKYRVEYDDEIAAETKNKLVSGEIASSPLTIGGEW